MKLEFKGTTYDDIQFWALNDKRKLIKIFELIKDIELNKFIGKGKPESLKYELSGYWSRRIDDEHRLIYKIIEDTIEIISCKYHYKR